jgi:hypothetical protein
METLTVKMYCQGQEYIEIIMETYGQDTLPRPRIHTDHHGDTYGQDILPSPRVYTDHHLGNTYGHDVLPSSRVYTNHHHGDTYGQDVLPRPRVYRDHHGDTVTTYCEGLKDMYESRCIAKAKGIYRSSSWRHVEE